MDIATLRTVAADLFGNGWQTRLAKALGIDGSTVRRWLANGVDAPPYVAAYLETLGDRQEARGAVLYSITLASQPASFAEPKRTVLQHMLKRLPFPGVEQLKPMPAIHVARDGDRRLIRLDGAVQDQILDDSVDLTMVRHPDTRHLDGFLGAAGAKGHMAAVTTHRFHHYSLLASLPIGEPRLTHVIATHAGEIRTTTALVSDPGTEISSGLGRILEFG